MTAKKPLFNLETVQGLRELSEPGKDFFAELAEIYLKQAPEKVAAIEASLNTRKFKTVSDIAHQLKSSTGNLGAAELAEQFKAVEEAGRAADLENLLRLVPVLSKKFGEACAELKQIAAQDKKAA